jgi:hypothetical protein
MDNKPVHITLGCARFLAVHIASEIAHMNNMKDFYQSRLDELSEAIKAAAQSQESK